MNQTENDKYKKADNELNQVYNQIQNDYKNDSTFIEKLKISQRLWIKFRDAELEMKYPESDKRLSYGSMYPMCATGYLTELTIQRTEKLKKWLEPIPDGEGCSGSIKYRESSKKLKIEKVENYKTQRLLNNFNILKDLKTENLIVKIISVDNLPGSEGLANGEITNDIYIAVSEFDEYPNQSLFKIDNLYNPEIKNIDLTDNNKPIFDILYGPSKNRKTIKTEITINEIKTSR
jgi:uncharacterized protein YecT (DUF1311 family)